MPMLAGVLWWVVLGALLGWMGSWVFNRTLRTRVQAEAGRAARVDGVPIGRIVERTIVDTRALDARDATIRALRARVDHLGALADVLSARVAALAPEPEPATIAQSVRTRPAAPALDIAAAGHAGLAPRHVDDLEIVEGIGPRIAELLRGEGIATWRALAACSPARLREVLALGGPGFRIADPGTWPEQAALAADGRWTELKALQDRLVAGRRPDPGSNR